MSPRTIDFTKHEAKLRGINKLKFTDSHHMGFRQKVIQDFLMEKIPENSWVQRWLLNNSEMWLFREPRWQNAQNGASEFPDGVSEHLGRILYVAKTKPNKFIDEVDFYVLLGNVDVN